MTCIFSFCFDSVLFSLPGPIQVTIVGMAKPTQQSNTGKVVSPVEIHWCRLGNPPVDIVSFKRKEKGEKEEK